MLMASTSTESEKILSMQVEVDEKSGYSSDPEIRKVQEHAEKLDIISLIKNIVHSGDASKNDSGETEWEGCTIKYKCLATRAYNYERTAGDKSFISLGSAVAAALYKPETEIETKYIRMKDGTVLFASQVRDGQKDIILAFRNGAWVERLQEYSKQLTSQFEQNLQDKENARKEAQLKPFTDVDF